MTFLKIFVALLPLATFASDNLDYGIPGACDQLIEREGYALGYVRRLGQPRWVAYRLTAAEATNRVATSSRRFYFDPAIRFGTPDPKVYLKSNYARGHLAPAADMRFSTNALVESYSMANVSPQRQWFNMGVWKRLEEHVRKLAVREGSVFVVTGPMFPTNGLAACKSVGPIPVPTGFYKVVLVENPQHRRVLAYIVPNESSPRKLTHFEVDVEDVEKAAGLDLWSLRNGPFAF